ncbi:alpha-amylase/4-alpha-glucanotransferase domain-containing protein [Denitratisoma oestradiolicum]|uniref:Glycosyl hydrolase n=1 Tax=Denitratisoma oestradiolicum TaxID=311182 RepID=A0A6S6XXL5_9PROT|nr:alpha-amylase/4-alpha-glucanotransferase domain-containing protein [Denitratisoma oestradiolicum]TWO81775.1 glycosyl hydrolase [Denitratisoma oestradiolicum]CAB1370734.1 Glycosyl hydrolase [Denitratisoma oestradiolicum]
MNGPISLLFGVHAHQPVGNFPAVIEDAHLRCYRMFLRTVAEYPDFRFAVHFSGWLLDVLTERFPEDMTLLETMTRRGQVEWFGSGDCEPVLAAIPHRDRVSQLLSLSDKIERRFGRRPQGAWLTERVWEADVVPSLVESGIRYVAVDDYHFLCTGQPTEKLDGHWTTEENGQALDMFPISEQARYRLPFSPAAEAVAWLEDLARRGQRAAIYFDDIEKFGIWPETYNWVYERGWLTQFIEGVLASPLIRTAHFADFHREQTTRGIVYLPTASYIEMNEWTLPGPSARRYHALVEAEKQLGRYESAKPFLRGGIWRNFFTRYPESNWMHKRMLEASRRLASLPADDRTAEMQEMLHRAQANDAYWHGLFGGLYLPHLRRAVWNNLLALEAALDTIAPRTAREQGDIDLDGHRETFLRSPVLQAVCRDDGLGTLIELSAYEACHNFGDTLRRHDEAYHDKIDQALQARQDMASPDSGIVSAHDRVAFLHDVTVEDARPDTLPRALFLDTWIASDGSRHLLDHYQPGNDEGGNFNASGPGWRLDKQYAVNGHRLGVSYRIHGLRGRLETRINLSMPSCDGYGGRYILSDGSIPCGFGQVLELSRAEGLSLDDSELGGTLLLRFPPATVSAQPHHTVSQSEAGFERVMQGAELTLSWPLNDGEISVVMEYRPHKI